MAKSKSALLVRGMGVGMRVLQGLTERIRERGGDEELLHLMTKKRFGGNLDILAQAIIDCDWQIPASEMRDLAEKEWIQGMGDENLKDTDFRAEIRNLQWVSALCELGIGYETYGGDDDPRIPHLFLWQLDGMLMSHPLILSSGRKEYDNYKEHVVVHIDFNGATPKVGELLRPDQIRFLAITDAKYFDFDR